MWCFKNILAILAFHITLCSAGIVDFEGYAISPANSYVRNKFTFSGTNPQTHGKIDVELILEPEKFTKEYNFYFLIADASTMKEVERLQENKQTCVKKEEGDPMTYFPISNSSNMPIFRHVRSAPYQHVILAEAYNITEDGEFYTVLCVCPHEDEMPKITSVSVVSYKVDKSKPYMTFEGYVSFKNPYGYLSADQVYYMRYYFFMSLVYVGFACFWVFKLLQKVQYLIFFHYVICGVFAIAFFETWFIYINYDIYNRRGRVVDFLFYIAAVLSVVKMTSIILITMLVSLGYKITRKSIFKYTLRLTVLGIVYFLCSTIYIIEKLYSTERETSHVISFMAKIPFYATNAVAFAWMVKSLTKTIIVLKKTKQVFKIALFNNFYYAVLITFGILIFGGVLQIGLIIFSDFDTFFLRMVSSELLPTLFSLIIFAIMLTMRPTTKSKLLVHHEELQEEHTEHSVDHEYGPHRASIALSHHGHSPGVNHYGEGDSPSKSANSVQMQVYKKQEVQHASDEEEKEHSNSNHSDHEDDEDTDGEDSKPEYEEEQHDPGHHEQTEELDVEEEHD